MLIALSHSFLPQIIKGLSVLIVHMEILGLREQSVP